MDHICAPWRSEYFGKKEQGCVFCNVVNHPEKVKFCEKNRCFSAKASSQLKPAKTKENDKNIGKINLIVCLNIF